jgi:hypothetical protein
MKQLVLIVAAVLLLAAGHASAQELKLAMANGRVSLDAKNVPLRQILTEWARIGGVKIVNGEKVTGPLVTLSLPDLPERQALEIILRGVSGYMLAERPAGKTGASTFDRILILPTSVGPKNPAPPATPQRPGFIRPAPMAPIAPVAPPPDEEMNDEPDVVPDPRVAPRRPPLARPPAQGGNVVSVPMPIGDEDLREAAVPAVPSTTPANPFGITSGSGRPGVVSAVPQPTQTDEGTNGVNAVQPR